MGRVDGAALLPRSGRRDLMNEDYLERNSAVSQIVYDNILYLLG
jgi:hypothetical protein